MREQADTRIGPVKGPAIQELMVCTSTVRARVKIRVGVRVRVRVWVRVWVKVSVKVNVMYDYS